MGGVPLDGVVDTGADITLIGAEAFKRIATVAKLHRRDFKRPDKTPRTYDQKTFRIDGRFELLPPHLSLAGGTEEGHLGELSQ